ncbi:YtpI family protein [Ectobacillus sp. JY-23]|uniref:YtpI family protein n=1 Tax=Ectobacillus sp. JY-23 TaxID=2933872 RepID=UPI001FF23580|nr:YtpI family protein [Ectobacillus sp. JY-23]UOY94290.1 YtpI family protein [Ectobacillus sp. JY-23]
MLIFVFLIIVSFVLYLFYKTRYFRTQRPMEKRWLSGKSGIALGLFVAFFGLNQFFVWDTTTSRVVGAIFLIYGGLVAYNGFRQYKHFLPLAIKEAEELK